MSSKFNGPDHCPICGANKNQELDLSAKLISLWRKKQTQNMQIIISLGERIIIERLINQYGEDKVKAAFIESCTEPERMKLSYVRGILKKEAEKKAIEKNNIEKLQKARETAEIGKHPGFDFSDILNKIKLPEPEPVTEESAAVQVKNKIDKDAARQRFLDDLKKNDPELYNKHVKA